MYSETQSKTARQFEKATFSFFKTGADSQAIADVFRIEHFGARIQRLQLAEYYGWQLNYIDDMTVTDFEEAYRYMAAVMKAGVGTGKKR